MLPPEGPADGLQHSRAGLGERRRLGQRAHGVVHEAQRLRPGVVRAWAFGGLAHRSHLL